MVPSALLRYCTQAIFLNYMYRGYRFPLFCLATGFDETWALYTLGFCVASVLDASGDGNTFSLPPCWKDDILDSLEALPGCGDHKNDDDDVADSGDTGNGLDKRVCPRGGRSDG